MFNLVLSLSLSHTGHRKFNMALHGKELSEDLKKIIVTLHKDKKIAKTLKLNSEQDSPWLTKEVECTCSASYPEVVFWK